MTIKMSEISSQDGRENELKEEIQAEEDSVKVDSPEAQEKALSLDEVEDEEEDEHLNVDEESSEDKATPTPVDLSRHLQLDRNTLKFSAFLLRNRSLFSQCGEPPSFLRSPYLGGILKDKEAPEGRFFTYSNERSTPSPAADPGPRRGLAFSVENILDPKKFTGGNSSALAALVSHRLPSSACCWRPHDADSDHDDASGKFVF